MIEECARRSKISRVAIVRHLLPTPPLHEPVSIRSPPPLWGMRGERWKGVKRLPPLKWSCPYIWFLGLRGSGGGLHVLCGTPHAAPGESSTSKLWSYEGCGNSGDTGSEGGTNTMPHNPLYCTSPLGKKSGGKNKGDPFKKHSSGVIRSDPGTGRIERGVTLHADSVFLLPAQKKPVC